MSKIAFNSNPLGTGTFTIASPNSNSDRTFTLPDATGTVLTSAGGTMTGTYGFGGFISLQTSDANGYPRINGASSSAQLGLFRSSGGTEGGMFIGGDGDQFSVWSSSFTRRLNVSQAGIVTMPNQPAFQVFSVINGYSLGAGADFVFDGVRFNRGNNFNTSISRFTAPVAGVYMFHFQTIQIGVVNNYAIALTLNGSTISGTFQHGSNNTGNWEEISTTAALQLAAGDSVGVRNTSSFTVTYHGNAWSNFSGYLIG
jgi:hypothetical protein